MTLISYQFVCQIQGQIFAKYVMFLMFRSVDKLRKLLLRTDWDMLPSRKAV